MKIIKVQKIDGEFRITLPEGVSLKDFEDWLNKRPNHKNLCFEQLPERWTSAENDKCFDK